MTPSDLVIYSADEEKLHACSKFGTHGMWWPTFLEKDGKRYKFNAVEVLTDWMIGNYWGHVSYNIVKG